MSRDDQWEEMKRLRADLYNTMKRNEQLEQEMLHTHLDTDCTSPEIERLRGDLVDQEESYRQLDEEVERLRAALEQVSQLEAGYSHESAWAFVNEARAIARRAREGSSDE